MRSKMSTFESTPMPMVRMKPAIPGSVMVAPRYDIRPSRTVRFTTIDRSALKPDSL